MATKAKPSKWGSLLSGAVAGLEKGLDTILADEKDASAKSRAAEADAVAAALKEGGADKTTGIETSTPLPPSRPSSRLQDRLSKAAGTRASSALAHSDQPAASGLASDMTTGGETAKDGVQRPPRVSSDATEDGYRADTVQKAETLELTAAGINSLAESVLPINPAATPIESTPPEIQAQSADPEINAGTSRTVADLETEIERMRQDNAAAELLRREEMDANLERIDALQAKLHYLANDSVTAAKQANASSTDSANKILASKDERIALLLIEGEKLSKKELRNLATIKRLNDKTRSDGREIEDLRRKVGSLEASESMLSYKVQRLEQSEKQDSDRQRHVTRLESDLTTTKSELDMSNTIAASLRQALSEADQKVARLQTEQSDTAIDSKAKAVYEEKLEAAERDARVHITEAQAELRQVREEMAAQKATATGLELELRAEVSNLESRIEGLRYRVEEASTDTAGDAQAKLLRQIETLQTQYSLAAENWRTVEASMTGRITTIELERDEAVNRETELRKRARDLSTKSRKLEEELERVSDDLQTSRKDIDTSKTSEHTLTARIKLLEDTLEESKTESDRQRQVLEAELAAHKLEDERRRSSQVRSRMPSHTATHSRRPSNMLESLVFPPTASSAASLARHPMTRLMSSDSASSLTPDRAHAHAYPSHRPSITPLSQPAYPWRTSTAPDSFGASSPTTTSHRASPNPSLLNLRNLSSASLTHDPDAPYPNADADADADAETHIDGADSPRHAATTIGDLVSASTVHAGPSVQLVERMSASIRRLETEKAAHKDEMARVLAQRDEARDQVVVLVRETEARRVEEPGDKIGGGGVGAAAGDGAGAGGMGVAEGRGNADAEVVRGELEALRKRYDACLEMLGEKEEECVELKGDVDEMKRIYRDLAAQMGR